ncbi:oligoendopeptidase F, partial [Staphylococcus epidermidis]
DLRGYDSVFDYLLSDQEVSRETFDRQIDVIIDELGPVMQKYVKLLQKERGLDKMLYSDLQIDLDPEFAPKADLESTTGYISEAVSVLGEDYKNAILKAFPERWVDFPANAGKESGGFETTPYGLHPYILMSWTGVLP